MNKKPVSYLQTDPKWGRKKYATSGESSTIASAGCGPTAAAMLITTLTGKKVTPVETSDWAMKKGYKAYRQGTYYSYFVPQFKAYGLKCTRLNFVRMLNDPDNKNHDLALSMLRGGHYLIALMGPGRWTKSGHFVVVWWEDGVYHILDPASTGQSRVRGDISTFRRECRMYWAIDGAGEEEKEVTQEQFNEMMKVYLKTIADKEPGRWSEEERVWAELNDIVEGHESQDGKMAYKSFPTREQVVVMLKRSHDIE